MKELSDYPDLLTVPDVCCILRISRKTVYQYVSDHTLMSRKIAGKHRIPKASIIKFIREINGDLCYNNISDGSDALHINKGV